MIQTMKILFVTNMYPSETQPVNGIFVKEQIDQISQELTFEYDVFLIDGINKGKLEYLKSIFQIPRQILSGKYDVVHIHYGLSALFLLFFKPNARVFLTLHGSDIFIEGGNKWQVAISKMVLNKVDKVFILNQKMEEIVRPYNPNYELVPCGVDTDFFKPTGQDEQRKNEKLIVFSNSPQRQVKNFPLFQKTIQILAEKSDHIIKFACIENLSREGVRDLLNTADCLLLTSLSEGSPQVVKEALACGLPVVSVPVGDVRFMMDGVPRCAVSQAHHPEELADLVLQSFVDKSDRESIRQAFMRKGTYDHASVTRKIIDNYQAQVKPVLIDQR